MFVRNKYLIVTSDAFLLQNNAFKHTVCTALLWKKYYKLCVIILSKQIPQLIIISKWTTEFNYIFGSMWNKNNFFHAKICLNDVIVMVITFCSSSCLGQETAKGPFGLRVKLPPVYHTRWRFHTVPLFAERQAGKLWITILMVFGMTRPGIEPESTASVADALSTRPLIGLRKAPLR